MSYGPLVSILINNYNYGRFLGDAIDSALNQTYPNIEVIVVDDGSTDDSREVIASYGDRIIPILKENGGQASAFNAGFAASKGDLICFLDADDMFLPEKVQRVVNELLSQDLLDRDVLFYHHLMIVDASGNMIAERFAPLRPIYHGNYYQYAVVHRSVPYVAEPPSGSGFTRSLGRRLLPVPELYPSGADDFFVRAAGLIAEIYCIDVVLSKYRAHGQNRWYGVPTTKPEDFYRCRDTYLNQKLIENGLEPVLSYFDAQSHEAREFFRKNGRYLDLYRLAFVVLKHRIALDTIKFSLRTLYVALRSTTKRLNLRSVPSSVSRWQ